MDIHGLGRLFGLPHESPGPWTTGYGQALSLQGFPLHRRLSGHDLAMMGGWIILDGTVILLNRLKNGHLSDVLLEVVLCQAKGGPSSFALSRDWTWR
jgi:hypothetical protein